MFVKSRSSDHIKKCVLRRLGRCSDHIKTHLSCWRRKWLLLALDLLALNVFVVILYNVWSKIRRLSQQVLVELELLEKYHLWRCCPTYRGTNDIMTASAKPKHLYNWVTHELPLKVSKAFFSGSLRNALDASGSSTWQRNRVSGITWNGSGSIWLKPR